MVKFARALLVALGISLSMHAPPLAGAAQDAVTEAALKAAFVYNFARFTEWSGDSLRGGPFTMCVLGDDDLASALESTVRQRSVAGHEVVVARVSTARLPACNLLYLSELPAAEVRAITDRLIGTPTVTVSSGPGFARSGGIIGLYVEDGRMRFAINMDAAQRAHLRFSSRLLSLAKVVRDDEGH